MTYMRAIKHEGDMERQRLMSKPEVELVAAGFIPATVLDFDVIVWEQDDGAMGGVDINGS